MSAISRSNRFAYLLVLPASVLILALTLFPIGYNVYLSLFQKHAFLDQKTYVGVANYVSSLKDPEFYTSFRNGMVYASATIVLQVLIGLACAILLNEHFHGRNFLRGMVLFPYLLPTIVVVILWKWLLNSSYGLVNYILLSLHLVSKPVVWLSEEMIMPTLIAVSVWQFFPFVLLMVLARMQTIPEDLYRAARVDGAPVVSRFIHITLPQLRGVLLTVVLLRSIWMFTKFDTVWLLAGNEAVGKYIQTLPVYTYRKTFTYLQAGMGASLAVILFVVLLIGASAYLRIVSAKEDRS